MRYRNLAILIGSLVALFLTGCVSAPERELSLEPPYYAALPNGFNPLIPDQLSPAYELYGTGVEQGFTRYLERKHGRALNQLSLSGGGQNGAFGAGFLVGWQETGGRPLFDEVGGVSTGALLATHALLGTPADDAVLEEMYTSVTKDDIYKNYGIFDILSRRAHSLKDTAPLEALIAKHLTAETLERVAAAYDENRHIWVGTTNVDYDQTWIWDMGRIAKDGRLQLYRDVLLASASFPVVFPPVEIDGHLFVDGAARSNLIVAGTTGIRRPEPPPYGPGNFYVIDNGKIENPPEALRKALGEIAATTISVMMNTSMKAALLRTYFGARLDGYNFKMVAIPPEVAIGKDPLAFNPEQMRAAFDAGRALAKQPEPWSDTPPRVDDISVWAVEEVEALWER
jgi:hypothetical protein